MSEYKYHIKKIYQPSPEMVILEAGNKSGRPVFNYRPGQYAMISYKNKYGLPEDKHAFSLASSPSQKDRILFGIKIEKSFTQGLINLKEGDPLLVAGPYGKFYYDERKYADLVMIAGGIGITPFFSTLSYATDRNLKNKLTLIYSAKTKKCATFCEEIRELAHKNANISALFSFTDEPGEPSEEEIVHKRIDANLINNLIGSVYGKTFFICGPAPFMKAMVNNLLSLGVTKNQIKMEEFSMIPDAKLWPRLRNFSYALGVAAVLFTITFNLIGKSNNALAANKIYDSTLAGKINQTVFNRLTSIYAAKNKALADLNKRILAAAQETKNISTPSTAGQGSAPKIPQTSNSLPTTVSRPTIITPAPVVQTPPAYQPIPTPTTRVS